MSTFAVPSPQVSSVSTFSNGQKARSLSQHGMPKEPRNLSVDRPHRFSDLNLAPSSFRSGSRSPGPFSPPLSAKSFGTIIDSEPSTPAYSPRPNFDWDGSSLVLLKPVGSPFETPFSQEPSWDMIDPKTKAVTAKESSLPAKSETTPGALSPLSMKSTKSSKSHAPRAPRKEIKMVDLSEKLHEIRLQEESKDDKENELEEMQSTHSGSAPLGKLASKMKSMLSRKNPGEKKKSRKDKDYYDVEYLGDQHWTEM